MTASREDKSKVLKMEKDMNMTDRLFQDYSEHDESEKPADKFEIKALRYVNNYWLFRLSKFKLYVTLPMLTVMTAGLINLFATWYIDLLIFLYYVPSDEVSRTIWHSSLDASRDPSSNQA